MRRLLDRLYAACAIAGGVALVAVLGSIMLQVAGAPFGYTPRAADEVAGYAMAASAFLTFPYAFRRGDHIRVVLLIDLLTGAARRIADLAVMLAAVFLVGYLAWFSVRMAWQSWMLNELSQGLVPIPLWMPQLTMAVGNVVFLIAVIDSFLEVARGGQIVSEDANLTSTADR